MTEEKQSEEAYQTGEDFYAKHIRDSNLGEILKEIEEKERLLKQAEEDEEDSKWNRRFVENGQGRRYYEDLFEDLDDKIIYELGIPEQVVNEGSLNSGYKIYSGHTIGMIKKRLGEHLAFNYESRNSLIKIKPSPEWMQKQYREREENARRK